ncbi:MAG: hypothetical protein O3A21_08070, partial [Proteobacteria bacterium]|nr:hypothetical protein [Pseudomonadota bacterium]
RHHAGGPKHGPGFNALTADNDACVVDQVDPASCQYRDAELAKTTNIKLNFGGNPRIAFFW